MCSSVLIQLSSFSDQTVHRSISPPSLSVFRPLPRSLLFHPLHSSPISLHRLFFLFSSSSSISLPLPSIRILLTDPHSHTPNLQPTSPPPSSSTPHGPPFRLFTAFAPHPPHHLTTYILPTPPASSHPITPLSLFYLVPPPLPSSPLLLSLLPPFPLLFVPLPTTLQPCHSNADQPDDSCRPRRRGALTGILARGEREGLGGYRLGLRGMGSEERGIGKGRWERWEGI